MTGQINEWSWKFLIELIKADLCRAGVDPLCRAVINVNFSCPAVVIRSSDSKVWNQKVIVFCNVTATERENKNEPQKWQLNYLDMSLDWCLQCSALPVQTSSLWFHPDGSARSSPTSLPCWCTRTQPRPRLCPSCRTEGLLQLCPAI